MVPRNVVRGLFASRSMPEEMASRLQESLRHVEQADANELLGRDIDVLIDEFITEFEPATAQWDAATMTEPERATVQGIDMFGRPAVRTVARCIVRVPVEGEPYLFTYWSHSGAPMMALEGQIGPDGLTFQWEGALDVDPEQIKVWFNSQRADVERFLPLVNNDARNMNDQMRASIRAAIERRRDQELQRRKLALALPFPIARRPGAATPVRANRRAIRLEARPKSPAFAPEPELSAQIYEDILRDCRAMATMFERMPGAGELGEEQLRNLILGMLNTNYEGQVGGELFNGSGKTDILIRESDRNVFIAECKFYRGPASVVKAIDQLLSYLVWRDTKAALLLFHGVAGFGDAIKRSTAAVGGHPQCVRALPSPEPSIRSDYTFERSDDPERAIHLAMLPFQLLSRTRR